MRSLHHFRALFSKQSKLHQSVNKATPLFVAEALEARVLLSVSFGAAVNYAAGTNPTSVAVGDFNHDGQPDLAVANQDSNNVSVLLGNGNGTFQAAINYVAGVGPHSVTVGDFNGDGKADLAVADGSSHSGVSVLLGNGNGTFQAAINYAAGLGADSLTVGDFNGDGKADLAEADKWGGVSVLLGNGNGTFQTAVNYIYNEMGSGLACVTVSDFNRDGKADLAVASWDGFVSVLLGNGNGTFQSHVDYYAGIDPFSVTVGEFNGDGKADLAVVNENGTVNVLLGNGNGTFQTAVPYAAGTTPNSVAVGDFNRDGKADLAVVGGDGQVSILLGNGNGTFQPAVNYDVGYGYNSVTVGDFNGDGKPDLAMTYYFISASASSGVNVLLNTTATWAGGSATFAPPVSYAVGRAPTSVAVGDFNGDGKADLAVANWTGDNVSVLLGNGDGTFQAAINYVAGGGPFSVTVGDFNGDGNMDMAVADTKPGDVSILLGNGNGTFQNAVTYGAGDGSRFVTVGDFNGDGKADLAVANRNSSNVSVLLGNGNGTFQTAVNYVAATYPGFVTVSDFNGDGKADLAVVDYGGGVSVLLGNGNGTFQAAVSYDVGDTAGSVAVSDFNGDGKADLAVANCGGSTTVRVLLGNGNGTFRPAVSYEAPAGNSITVGDFNGDGKMDLAVASYAENSIGVLLGNGDGTFQTFGAYPTEINPQCVTVGDFNRDGKMDLAVDNMSSQSVSVLLNTTGVMATPVFSNLTAPAHINYGTALTTFAGTITAGAVRPPSGETVAVTLNGVTQNATIDAQGNFSVTFDTSSLPVAGTPYQVSYAYGGDTNFNSVTDNTTTTLTVTAVTITVTPPDNQNATLGKSKSFALGSFAQVAATGPFSVDVNWGDGSTDSTFSNLAAADAIPAQNHTYTVAGNSIVTITVSDAASHSSSGTFMVAVVTVDVAVVDLRKTMDYAQTAPDQTMVASSGAFGFDPSLLESAADTVSAAMVTPPGGTAQALTLDARENKLELQAAYDTQAALDADYPDGDYAIQLDTANDGTHALTLSLTGDQYPTAATFTSGTFDDLQHASPTRHLTLTWAALDYRSVDYVQVGIADITNGGHTTIFQSADPGVTGALDGNATSVTIPAGIFMEGDQYDAWLRAIKIVSTNTTDYPGVTVMADYGTQTDVQFTGVASTTQIVVTPANTQNATAGQSQLFDLGSFAQTDASSPFSVDVNWGDGSLDSIFTVAAAGVIPAATHTYATAGSQTVILAIKDADNNTSNSVAFAVNITANSTLATPVFSNLSGASSISGGTAAVAFSGTITAGAVNLPSGEIVAVTLNGVTQNAAIDSQGNFSTTFDTSMLPVSATPYQVTYAYGGDANFNSAMDNTTTALTVTNAFPAWLKPTSAATWDPGTQTLTVTGNTTITADPGTFGDIPASNVSGNASVLVNTSGNGTVVNLGSLSLQSGTTLDVGQNIVRLGNTTADPLSTIQGYIFSNQIISSALTTGYGLGYGNVSVGNSTYTEFGYTLKGDAKLTGTVGVNDLSIVLANYGQSTTQWQNGNFEYNPSKAGMNTTVNINDLSDVLGHYGITVPSSTVAAASVRVASAQALASAADNDNALLTIDGITDQPLLGLYDLVS